MNINRRRSNDNSLIRHSVDVSLPRTSSASFRQRGTPSIGMRATFADPLDEVPTYEPSPPISPRERFRSAVHKIITLNRSSFALRCGLIGAEPGVDPRRAVSMMTYGHIKQKCNIDVLDYSSVRLRRTSMSNAEFVTFLTDQSKSAREPWVKVRWINVGGLSWDVISALAIKYDIHPLAVENLLQTQEHARSKADYYAKHLFLRVLYHALVSDDPEDASPFHSAVTADQVIPTWDNHPTRRQSSNGAGLASSFGRRRQPEDGLHDQLLTRPSMKSEMSYDGELKSRKDIRNMKVIQELLKGQRVNVRVAPMCIFLFRDGTVISIHHDRQLAFTTPILERLEQQTSGLRISPDASLLVQSLLDLVVDQAMEVVEEYQSKILKLEQAVLLKPQMKHVVRLHALQGDLILHRRTLGPIKTLVYALRRYDTDRAAALLDRMDPSEKIAGYMSQKARVYLADVHDHMEHILTNLDLFAGVSDNLIDYTFNMSSYEMSVVMRRLTLATVIFLPLTVLAGYFGMNFELMWTVHHGHSDVIYWIIALPMLAILLPIFMWSDLSEAKQNLEKHMAARAVKRQYKS